MQWNILLLWVICSFIIVFVNAESGTFPTEYRQMWLDLHNDLRTTKLPFPAAGMPKLSWNEGMAQKALETAHKCVFAHNNRGYGENLYKDSGMGRTISKQMVTESMRLWGNERFSHHSTAQGGFMMPGFNDHWTQVISDRSREVGCAYNICPTMRLVVCNYIPLGNVRGLGSYKIGEPCSACPTDTRCENGLCANKNAAPIGNGVTLNNAPPPPPPPPKQNAKPKGPNPSAPPPPQKDSPPPPPPPPPPQKDSSPPPPPPPPPPPSPEQPEKDQQQEKDQPVTSKPGDGKPAVCVPKPPTNEKHPSLPISPKDKALQPADLADTIPLKLPGFNATIAGNSTGRLDASSNLGDAGSGNDGKKTDNSAFVHGSNVVVLLSLCMISQFHLVVL